MKASFNARLAPVVLALSASALTHAQTQEVDIHEFDEVNVTATKIAKTEQNVSRAVAQTDMRSVQNQASQSTPEAIESNPNISQTGGPRSATQAVNIRGLQGNKVLQVVDGVPDRFQSGHRASYFLDPALTKSVDIVKGPVSSVWGSGAIAGVVSQTTIDPKDILKSGQSTGGFVKLARNGNNDQADGLLGLGYSADHLDGLLAMYYKDGDDIKLGNGETLQSSAERSQGAMLKQNWYATDQQTLGVRYRAENVAGEVPNNASAPINGTSVFLIRREQTSQNAALTYEFLTLDEMHEFDATLSWGSIEIDEARVSDQRTDKTEQDTYVLSLDHVMRIDGLEVLLGAQAEDVSYDAQRGGTGGTRPVPPDASVERQGVYGQLNVPIFSNLIAELGARYDDYSAEAKNLNHSTSDDNVSVSTALVWRTTDQLTIALRRDEAFRAPSAEELYSTGAHFCMGPGFCNTFQPSTDLKPERAENIELLGKWSVLDVFGDDQLTLKGSVFQNRVDDFIEQIVTAPSFSSFPPSAGTTSYVNVEKAELEGFELEAGYVLAGYEASLGYGQVRGKDKATGEDLTNIPADSVTAEFSKRFGELAMLGLRATHTQDQDKTRYAANTANTVYDDYSTLDVFGSWTPQTLPQLTLDLNVKNLTDRAYRKTWAQLDAAGREVILTSTYSF